MRFGEKLRRLRMESGESQTKIAKKVGKTQGKWSEWENGKEKLEVDLILKIADVFGVSCDCLIRDEIEDPQYVASAVTTASPDEFPVDQLWDSIARRADPDTRYTIETMKRVGPAWVVDAIVRKIHPENPGNHGPGSPPATQNAETVLRTTITPANIQPREPEPHGKTKARSDRPK